MKQSIPTNGNKPPDTSGEFRKMGLALGLLGLAAFIAGVAACWMKFQGKENGCNIFIAIFGIALSISGMLVWQNGKQRK